MFEKEFKHQHFFPLYFFPFLECNFIRCSTKAQTGRAATDRRTAVRETGVSRCHGGLIEAPHDAPRASQYYRIGGFNGGPQLVPMMPRDASIYIFILYIYFPPSVDLSPPHIIEFMN